MNEPDKKEDKKELICLRLVKFSQLNFIQHIETSKEGELTLPWHRAHTERGERERVVSKS